MLTLYRAVLYLALPLVLLRLGLRIRRSHAYRSRFLERFGFQTNAQNPDPGGIWIHAVSVGEVNAAIPLINHILSAYPNHPLTVTTMTPTGSDRLISLFSNRVYHQYLPYDYPGAVNRFLKHVSPKLALIMETEIWPNVIHACHKKSIPIIYTNVRLSRRSYQGYERFRKLIEPTLQKINDFAVQVDADAQRLIQLGAREKSIHVTGNLKFDIPLAPSILEAAHSVRRNLGVDRPILVAASTHEGEETKVLEAFSLIRKTLDNTLLVLVPRHPERFTQVEKLCTKSGFTTSKRSLNKETIAPDTQVHLIDTMGELPLFLAACDVSFIGGSLVEIGGHNLLEANALGIPVIFGPHMFNFLEIADLALQKGSAIQVQDENELAKVTIKLLQDPILRDNCGSRGKELIEENRGSLEHVKTLISKAIA